MASLLSLIISIVVFLIGVVFAIGMSDDAFTRLPYLWANVFAGIGGFLVCTLISYIFWNFSRNNQVNKHQVNVKVH